MSCNALFQGKCVAKIEISYELAKRNAIYLTFRQKNNFLHKWEEYAKANEWPSSLILGSAKNSGLIGAHGIEQQEVQTFIQIPCLKWGDYAFHNVQTRTKNGLSNLGASLQTHGSIIIDSRRKRLIFQPYREHHPVKPSFDDIYLDVW